MIRLALIFLLFPAVLLPQELDAKLLQMDGAMFDFSKHKYPDATILLFWATWCSPCKKEMAQLENLVARYGKDKVGIIAIAEDKPLTVARVAPFIKSHSYAFIFLLDTDQEFASRLLVDALPHTCIIDKDRKIRFHHRGYVKGDEKLIASEIDKLIGPGRK